MPASDNSFILHVGLSKTGTTTLQRSLFAEHSDIYCLGKFVDGKNTIKKRCASQEVYNFLRPMLWKPTSRLNVEKHREFLHEQIIPQAGSDGIILASFEKLGIKPARRFSRILERTYSVFGPFKVMICLRNPLTWITSEYLQSLRGRFIRSHQPWMGTSLYLDLDEWLKKNDEKNLGQPFFIRCKYPDSS